MSWPPFNGDIKTADDVGPVHVGATEHRNDAEYAIVGPALDDEGTTITMVRKAPDALVNRVLGQRDGWVGIADHWHEVHEGPYVLCMTVVHSPMPGKDGRYGVVVWYYDAAIGQALRELNLRDALAVTVFAVGPMSPSLRTDQDARAAGLLLARLVTTGVLPWPPEDERDMAKWDATTAVIDVAVQSG